MDIYLEQQRKTVVVRQKWKYNWLNEEGTANWNYEQRRDWHHSADNIIWQNWSNKFSFLAVVLEETATNKHLHRQAFNVEFDIEWVLDNGHWTANVTKVKPETSYRSNVDRSNQTINVISRDLEYTSLKKGTVHNTLNHEYAHTLGGGDEYGIRYGNSYDPIYVDDIQALLNIGNELRERYTRDVIDELNTMIHGVNFLAILK